MVCINRKTKIMVVLGSRREAIQAAPIIDRFRRRKSEFEPIVVAISPAREPIHHVLTLFDIVPDIVFNLEHLRQGLPSLTGHVRENMAAALQSAKPDLVLTEGSCDASFACLLAAYHQYFRVAHLAVQVRKDADDSPSAQVTNRRLASVMAEMHFAATRFTKHRLLTEGASESKIIVTGNPLIDALEDISKRPFAFESAFLQQAVACGRRIVLFIMQSEEPADRPWQTVFGAAKALLRKFADIEVVAASAADAAFSALSAGYGRESGRIHLMEAPDEATFVNLLKNAHIVVTDSDRIPEDTSPFQKPALIINDGVRQAPGIYTRSVKTVACDCAMLVREAELLLTGNKAYRTMTDIENPYGDGHAAERIVTAIGRWSNNRHCLLMPSEEFSPRNPLTDLLCQDSS